MKRNLLAVSGALVPLALSAADRPNIIFFLIDDYGWVDSQVCYDGNEYPFNTRFDTPNMLRLASKGAVFSNAYACPLSTPTRTSLMTGVHAAHERITNHTDVLGWVPSDIIGAVDGVAPEGDSDLFTRPDWNYGGLSPVPGVENTFHATPMVQILRDNGYYTIHVGKAHWAGAGTPGSTPNNMGFLRNIAGSSNGQPRSYLGEENFGNTPEKWTYNSVMDMPQYYGKDIFLTEALTQEALKSLDYPIEQGLPFYLYMSHYATHGPITKDKRFYDKYKGRGLDNGQSKYASMVEGVDRSLGEIMDYLDEKGVADNTVIVMYADNGGKCDNLAKGGELHRQNLPLREGKGSCYEGGVREPLIVFWPSHSKAGSRIDIPVSCEDFFPTFMDFAGIGEYTTVQTLDGKSFAPLVEGTGTLPADRPIISHYPHRWKLERFSDIDYLSAVRVGNWKFVYRMENAAQFNGRPGLKAAIDAGAFELYNLSEDLSETRNVAARYPKKTLELLKILSDTLRTWDASMPHVKATGKTLPLPDELL